MGEATFIKVENISKTFPGVRALNNVSFDIQKGEVHALMGENGAGKSTLIKILSGVYQPDPGASISIEGSIVDVLSPISSVQKGIAVTYQDLSLFPNLSVAENIAINGEIELQKKILNWKKLNEVAKKILRQIGIDIDVNARLGTLSTAKQQLVAICRALASDARLLILDEPTASLSSKEVQALYEIIDALKETGIATLFISHKIEEVYHISDRISVLRDGEYMGTFETKSLDQKKLISLMVGRSVEFIRKPHGGIQDDVVLELRNLSKLGNYKDISLSLKKGEILGITGLVGAGRTEVVQTVFGVNRQDSGDIYIDGKKADIGGTENALKHGIALVPESRQDEGLILRKSVAENIVLAGLNEFVGRLNILNEKKMDDASRQWIDKLRIKPGYPDMLTEKLSGGNQQRVVVAKWLLMNPKILIIDEPTNGIDVGAKEEIHNILRELAKKGIGIIMISSELPEVLAVSDRILVMRRGKIVAEFDAERTTQEQIITKAL